MTTADALVSVVVPIFNGERFIGRTLESALAQTYDAIEVIAVDDGSTDRTPIIVKTIAAKDPRVRYFRTDNSGVAAARNFGIAQARGNLIALLDHDDLWHRDKIARQVELMQASPAKVGLVYCWALEIDDNDLVIPSVESLQKKRAPHGAVMVDLAKGCFIESSSAALIKRSLIEDVGGYDPALQPQGAEDWKLYFSLSEICEFAVIPRYLVGYRQTTGSLSRNINRMGQSIDLVISWIYARRPELPPALRWEAIYLASVFMAQRALDNNQFLLALQYSARGYRIKPAGLFEQPFKAFATRFLARMSGMTRSSLRRRGWVRRVSFDEFQNMMPQHEGLQCLH